MQNAIWNGKRLIAFEVADSGYEYEETVRIASRNKELICPDEDCRAVLKYCNGDIKGAYFAHRSGNKCDYAEFDNHDTDEMKNIRKRLYTYFKNLGYDVSLEEKIIPHHYTPIYIRSKKGNDIVIEIQKKYLDFTKINALQNAYKSQSITANWIIVDTIGVNIDESRTASVKRHLLHTSDLFVTNADSDWITQYRLYDNRKYPIHLTKQLDSLNIQDEYLSLNGFDSYFEEQVSKINKPTVQTETKRLNPIETPQNNKNEVRPSVTPNDNKNLTYDQLKQEILPLIDSKNILAKDSLGNHWIKCRVCGTIDTKDKFSIYSGLNEVNLGLCRKCERSRRGKLQ